MDEARHSIGDVARITGVTPGVLRAWELRYGFPRGHRTASGHRRFGDEHVAMVREVLAAKQEGLPLEVAVRRVVDQHVLSASPSLHAEITRRFPALAPRRLRRDTLVALSHAIEDECLARSDRPVLFGSFQRDVRFRGAEQRWLELARTSRWCVVMADFAESGHLPGPVRVALPPDSPMLREWSVVCLSPGFQALLVAWEIPGQEGRDASRAYEAMLSTDPHAVHAAASVLAGITAHAGVAVPDDVAALLGGPAPAGAEPLVSDRLFTRAAAYLDEQRG